MIDYQRFNHATASPRTYASQEHDASNIVWLIECIYKMMGVRLSSGSIPRAFISGVL